MKKTMKLLLLTAFLICGLAQAVYAHPPKSVALNWNSNGTLTVNVSHGVNDPGKHYVYRIVVYVNDKIAGQKEYASQSSAEGLSDTFSLGSLASGTNVKAEAFCVIMGSTTGSLRIP